MARSGHIRESADEYLDRTGHSRDKERDYELRIRIIPLRSESAARTITLPMKGFESNFHALCKLYEKDLLDDSCEYEFLDWPNNETGSACYVCEMSDLTVRLREEHREVPPGWKPPGRYGRSSRPDDPGYKVPVLYYGCPRAGAVYEGIVAEQNVEIVHFSDV